jgi:hypothetical protein
MLDDEDRDSQLDLLRTHQHALSIYLRQQTKQGGEAQASMAVMFGIDEARENIRRIKEDLRKNGVEVEDRPNDTPHTSDPERFRLQVLQALARLEEPDAPTKKFPPSMVATKLEVSDIQLQENI